MRKVGQFKRNGGVTTQQFLSFFRIFGPSSPRDTRARGNRGCGETLQVERHAQEVRARARHTCASPCWWCAPALFHNSRPFFENSPRRIGEQPKWSLNRYFSRIRREDMACSRDSRLLPSPFVSPPPRQRACPAGVPGRRPGLRTVGVVVEASEPPMSNGLPCRPVGQLFLILVIGLHEEEARSRRETCAADKRPLLRRTRDGIRLTDENSC